MHFEFESLLLPAGLMQPETLEFEERKRRTALESVARNAATAWPSLAANFKSEKEFILTALKSSPNLPTKSEFERQFPQSVRFDRDVVLGFCARADFCELYKDRHLFVPDCLTDDKQVMLAYCSRIPRSLQECSEALCDDIDVVMAAVLQDGMELQYASMRLQECAEVVRAACLTDGRALEFCPAGPVRDVLVNNRAFILTVLRQNGGPMLRLVPEPLKSDRELLLEALAHGMRFRYCPLQYQNDVEFLQQALSKKSSIYFDMNRNLQAVESIALAAVTAPDSDAAVHERAFKTVPSLRETHQAVLAVAARGDNEFLKELFTEDAAFKDDKEIMLLAVGRDATLYTYASARLRGDPDVLVVAMDETTALEVLKTVTAEVQLEYPAIAQKAIDVSIQRNLRLLQPHIAPALWENRDICIAWIRRGCRVLASFEVLLSDADVACEVAEHSWREFRKVPSTLKNDREFMRRAVDKNGRVLRFAPEIIRDDIEMVVRAMASHAESLVSTIAVKREDLLEHVKSKLDLHHNFLHEFLRGIAVPTPHISPSRRSQLPMLDRGVETSQAFKQLIAAFLGVPVANDLTVYRTCLKNLTHPPPLEQEERNELEGHMFDRWARRRGRPREGAVAGGGDNAVIAPAHMDRVFFRFGMGRNLDEPGPGVGAAPNVPVPMAGINVDIMDMMMMDQEDGWGDVNIML